MRFNESKFSFGVGGAGAVDTGLGPSDIPVRGAPIGMICCGAGGVTGIGIPSGISAGELPIEIGPVNVPGPPKPVG